MSSMPDNAATLTLAAAMKEGGPALRSYVDAGGPNAVIARAELDRRAARKAGATYATSQAVAQAALAAPMLSLVPTEAATPVGHPTGKIPVNQVPTRPLPTRPSVDPMPSDPWHIAGAPVGCSAHGVTYPSGATAMAALGQLVADRVISAGRCSAGGDVAVTRGPWPSPTVTPVGAPVRTLDSNLSLAQPVIGPATTAAVLRSGGTIAPDPLAPVTHIGVATPRGWDFVPADEIDRQENAREAHKAAMDLTWSTSSQGYGAGDPARVEVVVEETRARAAADRAYLDTIGRELGFATLPTAVAEGAVLIEEGQRRLIASYNDYHQQPRTLAALGDIAELVGTEDRRDIATSGGSGAIRLLQDGRLDSEGREYLIEEDAFGRLLSRYSSVLPSAGPLLRVLPPALRCDVFNAQTRRLDTEPAVLRTRTVDGGVTRQVFAVVSPGYAAVDANEIATVAADALRRIPGGELARGPVEYDPGSATIRVDAVFHVDHTSNFGAGDIFKMGCRISSNDAGGGAIRVSFLYWRNLCLNLGILDIKDAPVVKLVHRGDRQELLHRMVQGIRRVMGYSAPFVERWTGLRSTPIATLLENPSADAAVNVRAILTEIAMAKVEAGSLPTVKRGALPDGVTIEGIARDVAVERMLSAWRHEPGDSEADIVNAVTRLHTERVPVAVLRSAEAVSSALIGHWSHA